MGFDTRREWAIEIYQRSSPFDLVPACEDVTDLDARFMAELFMLRRYQWWEEDYCLAGGDERG